MQDTTFYNKIDAFIKENERNIIEDIRTLVRIPSVQGEAKPGKPFGEEPYNALIAGLDIADRLGLETKNCENYLGYAELPGNEDARHIATVSHLDVVPEGNGWTGDPFEMREREGFLLGRGVGDNKGPTVLSLYIAKFFKENGGLKYGLRILLGTNEETGMDDVKYYLENYEAPLFTFSPDGAFPVCNGEKGIYQGQLHSAPIADGNIVEFAGGVASNVVPDKAHVLIKGDIKNFPEAEGLTITQESDGVVRVEGAGIGGHAASPKNTVNAIGLIVFYLVENNLLAESEKPFFETILTKVYGSTDGSTLGIDSDDGLFDPLTCIGGLLGKEGDVFVQDINVRFPTSTSVKNIEDILTTLLNTVGGRLVTEKGEEPFYIAPESPAIQCLLNTYNEITNREEKPFLMGGGTYARHFPNAVSYGIDLPNAKETLPDFVGNAHGADEGVSVATLMEALKIFIIAVARLNELEY